jgi:predicted SnoaL-like aldol condensation-catalyzing enzyme
MTTTQLQEDVSQKTGMTHSEMKQFVHNHFEEFVNRKNLNIGTVNFAPEFIDHGADVPAGLLGTCAQCDMSAGLTRSSPISMSRFLDLIAEDDKVVVRNHWTGTEAASGTKYEFSEIVIWRIAHRQQVERWAYLTPPQAMKAA